MQNKVLEHTQIKTGLKTSHRRENNFSSEYIVISRNGMKKDVAQVAHCRFYWTESRCYCCVWISGGGKYPGYHSGSGWAGGGGYCKASAAASSAIRAAGYTLERSISGVGHDAIREALLAVCRYNGRKNLQIIDSHG